MVDNINDYLWKYKLKDEDIVALQKILNATFDVVIRSGGEKGLPTHTQWMVTAPAKDKIYYTGTGLGLKDTVDNWFQRIKECGTESFFNVD